MRPHCQRLINGTYIHVHDATPSRRSQSKVFLFREPNDRALRLVVSRFGGPSTSKIRAPLFAARTLNATGQSRVTLSLR